MLLRYFFFASFNFEASASIYAHAVLLSAPERGKPILRAPSESSDTTGATQRPRQCLQW